MGSLTPEIRECIVKAYRQGYKEGDFIWNCAGINACINYIKSNTFFVL